MGNIAQYSTFAIKSKYVNMPVEGYQGKTIVLREDLINKSYTASSYIDQDLIVNLLTILLKAAVNSYTTILRVRICDI